MSKKNKSTSKVNRELATDPLYRKNENLRGLNVNEKLTDKRINNIIKQLHNDARYTPEYEFRDEEIKAFVIRSFNTRGSKDLYERVLYGLTHKMPLYTAERIHDILNKLLKEDGINLDDDWNDQYTYRDLISVENLSRNYTTQEAAELIEDLGKSILTNNYKYISSELTKEGFGSRSAKREARNFLSDYWFGSK